MKLAQRVMAIKPSPTLTINARAKALKAEGKHIISFAVGEPDFPTPKDAQQSGIDAILKGQTKYTAVAGIDELRDAIVSVIEKDYGLRYHREQVLVACGGKHALYNLFQALLDPGDEVIIPAPYWVSYPDMVVLAGAKPVIVSCDEIEGFKLTPEKLETAITSRTKLILINSPSNPTGAHYTRGELEALAEVLRSHDNVAIVSDDIYYRILFEGWQWINLAMVDSKLRERIFIVNGVSKTYAMTGWRIGYLIGDPEIIKAAAKIQSQSTSNPCSVSQWAALGALKGSQDIVKEMVASFEKRCQYVMSRLNELAGVTCPKPAGAFYVFPNLSCYYGKSAGDTKITDSVTLSEYLMEAAHVAVVPGKAFGEDRCIRLSYALSLEEIEEGFNRITTALKALK